MSERKFPFKIENDTHIWPDQIITGAQVRAIPPGIPATMDLFVKRKGSVGKPVADTDQIDLADNGLEHFYYQAADSTPGIA